MDSYIIGVDPTGNFWFNSDLANATSYNTLNRYEAESEPDRIQTLLVSHEDVVILGARTTEFWYDSGENINTFQRRDGTGFEIGCVSAHAAVNLDNTVYWRGHDGSAYRLNGYTAQRISTGPIERDWAKSDPSQCFAMTFVDRGHKIVYWTQPDGKTWGYDVATGEWHRRTSHLMDRWRANCLFRHKRTWYAGDYTNGRLYALGWKVNTEDGQPLVAERTTTVMQDDRNRFRLNAVEVVMDAQESAA
jgi:outer membrane protein assembly factor BamB